MPLLKKKAGGRLISDLNEILEKANSLAKNDPESAIIYYRRLLREVFEEEGNLTPEIRPEVSKILTTAGKELYKIGQMEIAMEFFEKAKEIDSRNPDAWLYIGKDLISKGVQLPYAIICLKEAAKLLPNNAEVWLLIGDGYKLQGKSDLAIEAYRKALSINPHSNEAYERIIEVDPNNVEILHNLYKTLRENPRKNEDLYVKILLRLSELENNISYIDEGLSNLPNNLQLITKKAYILKNIGKYEDAYKLVMKGLRINPDNEDLNVLKLDLEEYVGKDEEIQIDLPKLEPRIETNERTLFEERLEKTPMVSLSTQKPMGKSMAQESLKVEEKQESESLEIFGELKFEKKRPLAIEGILKSPIAERKEEKPTVDISVAMENAVKMFNEGRYREALDVLLEISSKSYNDEIGYYIGMCYYNLDEYEMAEAHFRNIYDKRENDENFLYAYAVTLINNEKMSEALKVIDKLLSIDRGNKKYLILRATALYVSGNTDEANNILTEILKIDMKNADAYYHKARVMAIKKNEISVKNFLMMAIKFDPTYKKSAKEDPYFEEYRDRDWFKEITS